MKVHNSAGSDFFLIPVNETTPKLYGWLHYNMYLSDGDHADVISEHERYEAMPLTAFFSEAFETAMHCRVMK